MGQVILGTRTLRFEPWARNHYEGHFKGIATRMYHKCKASGAAEFDLRGAKVKGISAREEASLHFGNVWSVQFRHHTNHPQSLDAVHYRSVPCLLRFLRVKAYVTLNPVDYSQRNHVCSFIERIIITALS